MDEARTWHYRSFYGLDPDSERDPRPLVLLHGNCQAESLRVLLDAADAPVRTVRMPPVHELIADDLPYLHKLLQRSEVVVSQPVRPGYRGLPLGTAEVMEAAAPSSRLVMIPVIRWAALHPFQVIVRSPTAGEPPIVPYHDLRTLTEAAGTKPAPEVSPRAVRAVRDISLRELRERQQRHATLAVDDLLLEEGLGACHVINHPGNGVLRGLARRILQEIGCDQPVPDPGRVLLDSVHAPVPAFVIEALGLQGDATTDWRVHQRRVDDAEIRQAHLAWYGRHPEVVAEGLRRHAEVAHVLLPPGLP